MSDVTYFVGNTLPALGEVIAIAGVPVDLTTATSVRLQMRRAGSSTLAVDAAATIVNAAGGVVRYNWAAGDLAAEGTYKFWWRVNFGTNPMETPEGNLEVLTHSPIDWGNYSGITPGPCADWCTTDDLPKLEGVEPSDFTASIRAASEMLYELSARLFPGVCTRTIRPCAQGCFGWGSTMGALWGVADSPSGGVMPVYGGAWSGWGSPDCSCGYLSQLLLPSEPVVAITNVTIDGSVVPSSSYRLDERRYLVGLGSFVWPACQNLNLAPGQAGTWTVTYQFGVAPPMLGKLACAELAVELWRAVNPDLAACALPASVRRVIRQGVQVERRAVQMATKALSGEMSTGLEVLDAFLAAYNPHNIRRRPAVWTPDRPGLGRRV